MADIEAEIAKKETALKNLAANFDKLTAARKLVGDEMLKCQGAIEVLRSLETPKES